MNTKKLTRAKPPVWTGWF